MHSARDVSARAACVLTSRNRWEGRSSASDSPPGHHDREAAAVIEDRLKQVGNVLVSGCSKKSDKSHHLHASLSGHIAARVVDEGVAVPRLGLLLSQGTMSSKTHQLFSVTIFGYRKPGMDEDAYHEYVSETHAGHLNELLIKNKIVSYHMASIS